LDKRQRPSDFLPSPTFRFHAHHILVARPSFSAAHALGEPSNQEVDMSVGVGFGDLVKFVEIATKTYKYGFSKAYRARKYRPP
jgi:hypothetical protein